MVSKLVEGAFMLCNYFSFDSSSFVFPFSSYFQTSAPEYVQDASFLCHFEFRWKTAYACPAPSTYDHAPDEKLNSNQLSCQVVNKNTNHRCS